MSKPRKVTKRSIEGDDGGIAHNSRRGVGSQEGRRVKLLRQATFYLSPKSRQRIVGAAIDHAIGGQYTDAAFKDYFEKHHNLRGGPAWRMMSSGDKKRMLENQIRVDTWAKVMRPKKLEAFSDTEFRMQTTGMMLWQNLERVKKEKVRLEKLRVSVVRILADRREEAIEAHSALVDSLDARLKSWRKMQEEYRTATNSPLPSSFTANAGQAHGILKTALCHRTSFILRLVNI